MSLCTLCLAERKLQECHTNVVIPIELVPHLKNLYDHYYSDNNVVTQVCFKKLKINKTHSDSICINSFKVIPRIITKDFFAILTACLL